MYVADETKLKSGSIRDGLVRFRLLSGRRCSRIVPLNPEQLVEETPAYIRLPAWLLQRRG
jgi:hypothetical protein